MRKGQALVVALLVLGVVMTVGLSVVSRSVTEVGVSTTQEEAARALEAAEAGVEQAVARPTPGTVTVTGLAGSTTYTATTSNPPGTVFPVPFDVAAGDVVSVDLSGYTFGANFVEVCWGKPGISSQAAVEVMVYFETGGEKRVSRFNLDANSASHANNFVSTNISTNTNCGGTTSTMAYKRAIAATELTGLGGTPLLMRVRMLYNTNPEPMAFQSPSANFPAQTVTVVSAGSSGDSKQKIKAVSMKDDLPPMFDSALFSGVSLIK